MLVGSLITCGCSFMCGNEHGCARRISGRMLPSGLMRGWQWQAITSSSFICGGLLSTRHCLTCCRISSVSYCDIVSMTSLFHLSLSVSISGSGGFLGGRLDSPSYQVRLSLDPPRVERERVLF